MTPKKKKFIIFGQNLPYVIFLFYKNISYGQKSISKTKFHGKALSIKFFKSYYSNKIKNLKDNTFFKIL